AIAHVQPALDVDAITHETVDLREERIRVEHDTVPDRAPDPGMEDSARDLVEHERRLADVDRMPGVRAALIAHDPIRALGEYVYELPFAFVAPLRADDDERANISAEHAEESSGDR